MLEILFLVNPLNLSINPTLFVESKFVIEKEFTKEEIEIMHYSFFLTDEEIQTLFSN